MRLKKQKNAARKRKKQSVRLRKKLNAKQRKRLREKLRKIPARIIRLKKMIKRITKK